MQITTHLGTSIDFALPQVYEGRRLLAIPAAIDPHVHFRVPGGEHKENWITGSQAALHGGVTSVFDMPNNAPAITTYETLIEKKKIINEQLQFSGIPLHFYLYIGATTDNVEEIRKAKNEIIGIKLFMGSSTGNLLVDKIADQENLFALAHELGLVMAVHAEDEARIQRNKQMHAENDSIKVHSIIRDREVAATAVARAIMLAEKFETKTYILHVSTKEEVALIRTAKAKGIQVFAETTPHHLYLHTEDYARLGTFAQMNPPLRTPEDNQALWEAIADGTIDTVGTDHAPHTLEEKAKPYPESPSGVPGIETLLPLLAQGYHDGKITAEKLVAVTSQNAKSIFNLPENNDWTIIDMDMIREVRDSDLKTKCGWSPFAGWRLRGWPVAVVLHDKLYEL